MNIIAKENIRIELRLKLDQFKTKFPIIGLHNQSTYDCFIGQLIDSIRRVQYIHVIKERNVSELVCDPLNIAFDPIKASIFCLKSGNIDEASWFIFLATHFGKNYRTKWQLAANVYSGLDSGYIWNWENVCDHIGVFRDWLEEHRHILTVNAKFGNHRKYESISGLSKSGTGEVVETYIDWVHMNMGHFNLFQRAIALNNGDSRITFSYLFSLMKGSVARFGRTAIFDYLTMIGKVGVVRIEPDSAYIIGSTGPIYGAKLLFGSNLENSELNLYISALESHLAIPFGMQILEDALCNWQKSPERYTYFRG